LYKNKEVDKVLALLKKKGHIFEKEGALWFKTTKFGDDKDRVLVRENGEETYFASDVAYLKNKFDRGFKKLIIFVGADHHGYVKRIKAAAQALGYKKEQVDFIVMQLVNLKEGRMSKRAGVFITLRELVDEVGLDAARFFFLQRAADSHLIFDLELAKKKSQESPVYYVQYAYARICSILRKAKSSKFQVPSSKLLNHPSELDLIKQIIRFPEIIEDTARDYQVQRLPQYAIELAEAFHKFYQKCPVLTDDKKLTQSRLGLIKSVQKVLKETLDLMGVEAPSKM
jgi:arginyl-tRNA synthetase